MATSGSEPHERPILFNGEMVRAILDGRKTQTRRIVKLPPGEWESISGGEEFEDNSGVWGIESPKLKFGRVVGSIRCPYGRVGDRLWIRETWGIHRSEDDGEESIVYFADPGWDVIALRRRPSIHMRRQDSRLTLEIASIRVERLQEITDADALAEGTTIIAGAKGHSFAEADAGIPMRDYTPRDFFRGLWETINGNWDANPWIWVIEFQRFYASR